MKITRFEDIQVWQRSRALVALVYSLTTKTDGFCHDYSLKDQIRRRAEGYARRSDKAFSNFLYIAHGPAAEVQSQPCCGFFRPGCLNCHNICIINIMFVKHTKLAKQVHK